MLCFSDLCPSKFEKGGCLSAYTARLFASYADMPAKH